MYTCMHVYVYMYICIYVYMYICTYIYTLHPRSISVTRLWVCRNTTTKQKSQNLLTQYQVCHSTTKKLQKLDSTNRLTQYEERMKKIDFAEADSWSRSYILNE